MKFVASHELHAQDTLQKIADMYSGYSGSTPMQLPLHFELASISSTSFMLAIVDNIIKQMVTSIGCNEQEIGMLHDFLVNPTTVSMEQVYTIRANNSADCSRTPIRRQV